jgi:long-chain fatty acid transport protein
VLAGGAWASDGLEPIALSLKSAMRGGADTAVGDTACSQIGNPATLSLHDRPTFDTSGEVAFLDVHWKGPYNSADNEIPFALLANAAYATPINDRWAFGMAFHSKSGTGGSYHIKHKLIPWYDRHVYSDYKNVDVTLNTSYKVTEKLSIGAGPRFEMATAKFGTVLGPAGVEFGRGYSEGMGFNLGLHYKATKKLSFGLDYRSTTWFRDLDGGQAKISPFGLGSFPIGDVSIDKMRGPQRVDAGVAYDVTEWFKLIGEARWINYSNCTFNKMMIHTDSIVDVDLPMGLRFKDQYALMLGGEFKLSEHWRYGLGYHWASDCVAREGLLPIATVLAEHQFTTGIRYETEKWWAGVGYIVSLPKKMHGNGSTDIPLGIDYYDAEIEHVQQTITFGVGLKL